MSLATRLGAIEKAMAKQNGEFGYRLVFIADGESENEAKIRAGLEDWPGPVIFIDKIDLKA